MGEAGPFRREILVAGVLDGEAARWPEACALLESRFGPIALESPPTPFHWTDYYQAEMGPNLLRRYLAFADPVDPAGLAALKLAANTMEAALARPGGGRAFNIDPGLLSPGRLCLASTKDRAQRIPLGSGIYAELTLIYRRGAFEALPWTYPDYASQEVRDMLAAWRARLMPILKGN